MDHNKPELKEAKLEQDFHDELDGLDIEMLLPATNINKEIIEKEECIIEDKALIGLYDEILDNCRKDRSTSDEVLTNFLDMVMNDGDASSASKEAIVNLLKIKTDISDKMAKVADLQTRIKLKDRDTFPRFMAANHVHLEGNQRELIKNVTKMQKANIQKLKLEKPKS